MADQTPRPPEQDRKPSNGDLWRYASLGTQLAITVIVFVGIGWWLDSRYGWTPWATLTLGVIGLAAGLYHFVKDALR